MDHFDERVKALQKRSLQVLPLKYRRETPQKLLPIEALCEFDTDEVCSVLLRASTTNSGVFKCEKLKKIISKYSTFQLSLEA